MALTRKFLQAMGIEGDKIEEIINAHTETVDALKIERDDAQNKLTAAAKDSETLKNVQKELDDLKAAGYEEKYNAEKTAHDALKNQITSEKTKTAKEAAVKAYFEEKGIKGTNLNIAMRATNLDDFELDGEKIKDTANLDALVNGDLKPLTEAKQKVVDSGGNLSGRNEGGKASYSLREALHENYDK